MIGFNVAPFVGKEFTYIQEAISAEHICGDGLFTKRCNQWIEEQTGAAKALLTTSCTHATEMAALLLDIRPGEEVIMPAYTFVSTANAFVLRGAVPVFVDIRPDTMNLDESLIEAAITERTRAIVPVHYAGVACEMDVIMDLAEKYNLAVVEDAAQGVMSSYKGRPLGTIGDYGCFSFHETKNFSMGEGGALLIRDQEHVEAAEILREKGTNRSKFFRGQVDKYTWVDQGSSYLPSDMNAAYLWAQLEVAEEITKNRMASFALYRQELEPLEKQGLLDLPVIPRDCKHNAHMFYVKARDLKERTKLIAFLKEKGVQAVFHYVPLHTAPEGQRVGRFVGEDRFTTKESERILRLPMYYGLKKEQVQYVAEKVREFYGK
ncbi:MAG: dTDP-4-amino-4,6-dideoxygalactose transaminase [Lachnospiraceae bacterium]|jgi:TDP-4-keto-6-deoxy-D-glucose transaminase|nr:dTDP-4-amino-4,6-dideoxygalactose transaminase [Lachnospiraceae bacterium]MCI8994102.1 dTDP-4-amino-4,6-dideoxygalactose transaminase [Lachnospiraceae bacterium]MCI9132694.1 dTDP-4-amino-4,6-dideoxygalactose transaminase [Lachnospiraceae bacterium]